MSINKLPVKSSVSKEDFEATVKLGEYLDAHPEEDIFNLSLRQKETKERKVQETVPDITGQFFNSESSYNQAYLEAVNEEVEKYKNTLFIKPKQIKDSHKIIKDENPYLVPTVCLENIDINQERRYLYAIIGGVDSNIIKIENGDKVKYKIEKNIEAVPYNNVKIFKNIKYENQDSKEFKYTLPNKIASVEEYLKVDEIFPTLKKAKKVNELSYNKSDDDILVERCDVLFVKYFDDAKTIKVEVLFDPLCSNILFFLSKYKEDTWILLYRSFYKVHNDHIVFRPYSDLKPPMSLKTQQIKPKKLVNIIKELNKLLDDSININSSYDEIIKKLKTKSIDVQDAIQKIIINEETFNNNIRFLKNKYIKYLEFRTKPYLEINNFEIQFNIIKRGSDTLHKENVKTIKRFAKLDPLFKLHKYEEVQQKLVNIDNVKNHSEIVFDIKSYIEEKILKYEETLLKKGDAIKISEFKSAKPEIIESFKRKFKQEHERNDLVLVNRQVEIYEPINFAYMTPFTLSDILSARYNKSPLFDALEISSESLVDLFDKIEGIRSFVFTFVSIYYQFKTDFSYIELKRDRRPLLDIKGKPVLDSQGRPVFKLLKDAKGNNIIEKKENVIKIDLYKIYPNQLYSSNSIINSRYIKYFELLERDKKENDYNLLYNEAKPVEFKPLKFLKLVEGIIEPFIISDYPYISASELFQPILEKAIINKDNNLIKEQFKKLTTIESNFNLVDTLDLTDLVVSLPQNNIEGVWGNINPDVIKAGEIQKELQVQTPIVRVVVKETNDEDYYHEEAEEYDEAEEDDEDVYESVPFERKHQGEGAKTKTKTETLIDNVFKTHLNYLTTPPLEFKEKAKTYQVDKKDRDLYISKMTDEFDKELAKKLILLEGRVKNYIYDLKIAQNLKQHLDKDKVDLLTNFFSNNTKKVKEAFVSAMKNMGELINKILEKGASEKAGVVVGIEDGSISLGHSNKLITDEIYQKIYEYVRTITNDTKQDKLKPTYQEIASLFFTMSFSGSPKQVRNYQNEIKSKIQKIIGDYKDKREEEEHKGIADDLIKSDINKNINGINNIISILKIVKIPYIIPRVVEGVVEDNAEILIQEIVTSLTEIQSKKILSNSDIRRYADYYKQLTVLVSDNNKNINTYKEQIIKQSGKKIDSKLQGEVKQIDKQAVKDADKDKQKYMKYKLKYLKLKELLSK